MYNEQLDPAKQPALIGNQGQLSARAGGIYGDTYLKDLPTALLNNIEHDRCQFRCDGSINYVDICVSWNSIRHICG
jgi:hypothetical protein